MYEVSKELDKLVKLEDLNFGKNFLEACDVANFQNRSYIITSTCDKLVHLIVYENGKLRFLNSLPGHLNKVKTIEVLHQPEG